MFAKKKNPLKQYIRNVLGYTPKDLAVYKQAFVHRSAVIDGHNGIIENNERLEYLGDAVLGSIVADFLFHKYPVATEGFLTSMRSRLVSREHLNKVSHKMGLDKLVITENHNHHLPSSINGDAFEAFVGAIFLDKGYEKTKKIIINRIFETHVNVELLEKLDTNYKGKVLTHAQKNKQNLEYKVVKETTTPHKRKEYVVYLFLDNRYISEGVEYTIKKAEQLAAMDACEQLGLD